MDDPFSRVQHVIRMIQKQKVKTKGNNNKTASTSKNLLSFFLILNW